MESTSLPAPGLVLQHGPHGPPGVFGDWLDARAIPYRLHDAWRDPLPANPTDFSFVASLGSEHSAAGREPEWVASEIDFIRHAVDAGVPVLGLCFGGQALAVALGAEVGPAETPEVGWMRIDTDDPRLVPQGPWLEFHFEVFEVPEGASEVARSAGGAQAFTLGPHLATQFHPEVTPEIVDVWAQLETRLVPLGVDRRKLLEQGRRCAPEAARKAGRLFDSWWARAADVRR
jgi:GMP synthase (glutamine-hydrolysing)